MTIKQKQILKSYVKQCADKYQSPSVLLLDENVINEFEQSEGKDELMLSILLGNVILDSHFIGLHEHQKQEFFFFWFKVVKEMREVS